MEACEEVLGHIVAFIQKAPQLFELKSCVHMFQMDKTTAKGPMGELTDTEVQHINDFSEHQGAVIHKSGSQICEYHWINAYMIIFSFES